MGERCLRWIYGGDAQYQCRPASCDQRMSKRFASISHDNSSVIMMLYDAIESQPVAFTDWPLHRRTDHLLIAFITSRCSLNTSPSRLPAWCLPCKIYFTGEHTKMWINVYPGSKVKKTDTACCKRLATRNHFYVHLGTQSIWTTLNFFCRKFLGSPKPTWPCLRIRRILTSLSNVVILLQNRLKKNSKNLIW